MQGTGTVGCKAKTEPGIARDPEIAVQVARLTHAVTAADSAFNTLADRIGPVLSPAPPTDAKVDGSGCDPSCQLAMELKVICGQLDSLTMWIEEAFRRTEL